MIRLISPSTLGASTLARGCASPLGAFLTISTVPFSSTKRPVALSPSRMSGWLALALTGTSRRVICSACSSVSPLQSTERIVSRTWPASMPSHPSEGGRAADAPDRDDERRRAEGDLALADHARERRVRLAHVPVELGVDLVLLPRELLDVLRPLEVRDGHAARVHVDVGEHGDAALGQDLVALPPPRRARPLHHAPRAR